MTTQAEGIFVGSDERTILTNPIGGSMVVVARDADTAGAFSLYDNILPPGSPGPRPHIHHRHDEAFYVLEGELTVRIGARTVVAPAGSYVMVPRGSVHQPANQSDRPVRVLLIFTPAGMGDFFEEIARRRMPLQGVPTDPAVLQQLTEVLAKYDYEFADFPAGA